MGISKPAQRSVSATRKARAKPGPALERGIAAERRLSPLNRDAAATIDILARPAAPQRNITIRGLAGPYAVIGSNFAPGTTAADIQSAMEPVGGVMQGCRILTASPTVEAEMVFVEKSGAEIVIATFNNQKADGRLLHVYMKNGPPSIEPVPTVLPGQPQTIGGTKAAPSDAPPTYENYSRDLPLASSNGHGAEPELQDGRYGFDNGGSASTGQAEQMDVEMDDRPPITESMRPKNPPPTTNLSNNRPPSDRRGGYRPVLQQQQQQQGQRYDQRGGGYDNYRGGGGRYDRGGPRDNRGLYSDGMYDRSDRSQGRGYR